MALTAQQMALRMAKHIGVISFDPSHPSNMDPIFQRGLQDGDFDEFATCINGALQEIWSTAPTATSHYRQSAMLPAPLLVTLTVTHGCPTISAFPDYALWMPGCTLAVVGGGEYNEIVDATTLRHPFQGASGSVEAVVYADCLTLPPEAVSLLEPLECSRIGKVPLGLRLVLSYEQFRQEGEAALRRVGIPEVAYLESLFFPNAPRRTVRLRVSPLPSEPVMLSYGMRLNVPTVSAADISPMVDPGRQLPLPVGWDESVLLPLANRRLATHPDFHSLTNAIRLEIQEQARAAHRIMRASAPNRSGESLRPTFR